MVVLPCFTIKHWDFCCGWNNKIVGAVAPRAMQNGDDEITTWPYFNGSMINHRGGPAGWFKDSRHLSIHDAKKARLFIHKIGCRSCRQSLVHLLGICVGISGTPTERVCKVMAQLKRWTSRNSKKSMHRLDSKVDMKISEDTLLGFGKWRDIGHAWSCHASWCQPW